MSESLSEEIRKYDLYFWVIGILVLIRFVFYPWVDWININQDSIAMEQSRLDRVKTLVANQDSIASEVDKLKSMLSEFNGVFIGTEDSNEFQLEEQRRLNLLLSEYSINVENIGWESPLTLSDGAYTAQRLSMTVEGKLSDIILLLLRLDSSPHFVKLSDFRLSVQYHNETSLGRARGVISLVFFKFNRAEE
ncbi:hypothetical protein [Alteromonas facilis]|uniref:hypothetical protein n=1 Tax=Alteromonas facilis TaxID=2048004 RepID=UPI000C29248A|nr:hypothetical protein [Alteromonas facilis]